MVGGTSYKVNSAFLHTAHKSSLATLNGVCNSCYNIKLHRSIKKFMLYLWSLWRLLMFGLNSQMRDFICDENCNKKPTRTSERWTNIVTMMATAFTTDDDNGNSNNYMSENILSELKTHSICRTSSFLQDYVSNSSTYTPNGPPKKIERERVTLAILYSDRLMCFFPFSFYGITNSSKRAMISQMWHSHLR